MMIALLRRLFARRPDHMERMAQAYPLSGFRPGYTVNTKLLAGHMERATYRRIW